MSSELDDELLELVGGSSDKEKQVTRKRNRDSTSSATGKSKTSKKRKVAADSDNEPESEDGDDSEELYPLEGKYIDEDDRAALLAKTEIEREQILAARLDEVDHLRVRKHLDKLHAQQLAAAEKSEPKRLPRSSGKDKVKDKTLNALKAKRKAKDERKRERGASPKQRSSSPMDMSEDESEEDGQVSKTDQENERLFGRKPHSKDENEGPLTSDHLLKIALTRDALVKHTASPWFEQIITGAWVRYCIGQDAEKGNEQVYRVCQIIGLAPSAKPYKLGDKTMHHSFMLKHGNAERPWQMDRTSNAQWTTDEFKRMLDTCATEKVILPSRKEVDERFNEMQDLLTKNATEDDITAMIARKRQSTANGTGTSTPALNLAERARLNAQRTLAQRRHDFDEVRDIDAQLAALSVPQVDRTTGEEELADRLARVNERNRKANLEAVRKAELLEAERKRRERKSRVENGGAVAQVFDPSARLRTVPRLFESATPTSRPSTPNPIGLGVLGVKTGASPSPMMNGAVLAGKTLEADIIESIEVDLGDF
ncbi:Plus3 domain-containing protein [Favolaschia claudopus]|uniref:Plus3 domain-containing protein n=1 Tax=Favolaschia claudopus TaxID=2862362 RepID=A0AAW0DZH4_9AGAR